MNKSPGQKAARDCWVHAQEESCTMQTMQLCVGLFWLNTCVELKETELMYSTLLLAITVSFKLQAQMGLVCSTRVKPVIY